MADIHDHLKHEHEDHHGDFHVVPVKYLVMTGVALLFLTVITVLASYIDFAAVDLTELNIIVAMAIAVVKASLVCLFFMHLRWDRSFNAFVLVASIAFVGLFITFAFKDTQEYSEEVRQYQRQIDLGKEPPNIQAMIDEMNTPPQVRTATPATPATEGH